MPAEKPAPKSGFPNTSSLNDGPSLSLVIIGSVVVGLLLSLAFYLR